MSAVASPCSTPRRAEEVVRDLRLRIGEENGSSFAYRIGRDGEEFRFSEDDDGTGRDLLRIVEARSLTDVALFVTVDRGSAEPRLDAERNACARAITEALDGADTYVVRVTRPLVIECDHEDARLVRELLADAGVTPTRVDYRTRLRMIVPVPERQIGTFAERLSARTEGRARITV